MDEQKAIEELTLIIGAGPAGLTAAFELVSKGKKCLILEMEDHIVGGIARTVKYKDWRFDIGGHRFFTKVDRVMKFWKNILVEDFVTCNRLSRIYFNKKFFAYPIKPFDVVGKLGIFQSGIAFLSYIKARLFRRKEEHSFEDYVINHFGKYLYGVFFKNYTEKVWGIPCTEIRADWAAQRIKGLSLRSLIKTALFGNQENIKSLIEQFYYPKLGPGQMWEQVLKNVEESGKGRILFSTKPRRLLHKNGQVYAVEIENTKTHEVQEISCSHVLSSMPLGGLMHLLSPAPPSMILEKADKLRYRDFILIALIFQKEDLFPDNWIYVHDANVSVGRIQNFKNWSQDMVGQAGTTCLGMEYFVFEGDDMWNKKDDELIELASEEIEKIGLGEKKDIIDGCVVRMQKTYPIYDTEYQDVLSVLRSKLQSYKNLYPIGRNGMHRYNNQDHSMLTAMLAVENIFGASHDLWDVNTEQVYHETIEKNEVEK